MSDTSDVMTAPTTALSVLHHPRGEVLADPVAVEEPLEIRVEGEPLAVLMRSPGHERALALGMLLTEGIIEDLGDVAAVEPCTDPNRPHAENVILVHLAEGVAPPESARRSLTTSASCGLCGKTTIEALAQRYEPNPAFEALEPALIAQLGERVRAVQAGFDATGGLHAAAVFGPGPARQLLAVAEDIGRHNAVDKVVGHRLLATGGPRPLQGCILWVSGRSSFEMAQKALVAGASALVCVGAPSSLAVDLAVEGRLTLVGFARGGARFNLYTGLSPDPG